MPVAGLDLVAEIQALKRERNAVILAHNYQVKEIQELAEGRVWLGEHAKQRDLVDAMGGLDKAIELVKVRAKLAANEKIRLIVYPAKQSLFEQLMARGDVSAAGWVDSAVRREIREWTGGMPMELFRQGAILRLMPYRLEFR